MFKEDVTDNFNMTFTLSGGATWGDDLGSSALNCSGCDDYPTSPTISIVDGGADSDETVTFLITGDTKAEADDVFTFSFSISDTGGVLGTSGGEVKLSTAIHTTFGDFQLEAGVASSAKTVPLVTSKDGLAVSFSAAAAGSSKIDVSQGNLMFLSNSGTNTTSAILGQIVVSDDGNAKQVDLSQDWSFGDATAATGDIVVSTAPFNASIADPGRVFIDTTNNGEYNEDDDFIADEVGDSEATWSLDKAQIESLTNCPEGGCDIVIEADGTTQIQPNAEAPQASATFIVDSKQRTNVGKLLHIKRNGSVCTLYNIPNSAAVDTLSVRITNMGNKEGVVLGTLRGLDGVEIFSNQILVAALAPNATSRIDAAVLKDLAGGTDWAGRAVLTLSSTIPEGNMEAYGLVRNRAGGPLMNLSAGASGNGCDN
jgi:hypothetical protein